MKIYLETAINAAPEVCFNLARDIDLHITSMKHTREQVVGGVTSGLIRLNDFMIRESVHFGIKIQLCTKITDCTCPEVFVAEQLKGPFKRLHHAHYFKPIGNSTLMVDQFEYELPFGFLGRFLDRLVLRNDIARLLTHRNQVIKTAAEQSAILNYTL